MPFPTIIYYGAQGIQAQVLGAYLAKLGLTFQHTLRPDELVAAVRKSPQPIVVLSIKEPPAAPMALARQLVHDSSSAFPHVFILHDGERFDAQLESVTVIAGGSKLPELVNHLRVFMRAPGRSP